jgi:hypothetical protein
MKFEEMKANLFDWLMDELAAHEGGDNICFTFDDATLHYVIYKRRNSYAGGNIRLGSARDLGSAIGRAMEKRSEANGNDS